MAGSQILFLENHAGARSMKNRWTRMASTMGCMRVVLTPETLTVRPHRIAGWLIRLLGLDLDHEIPVARIRGAEQVRKWHGLGEVEVTFDTEEGRQGKIRLYLGRADDFLEAIGKGLAASP